MLLLLGQLALIYSMNSQQTSGSVTNSAVLRFRLLPYGHLRVRFTMAGPPIAMTNAGLRIIGRRRLY
jgi:hypothetical protein